ncbi:MAG: PAS domain-containing protein, partial [Dehalococcoidia bacterium]|nr:PAS domain-containing protein [Dehalococcoidia bacterium]
MALAAGLSAACAELAARPAGLVLLDADAWADFAQSCRRLRDTAFGRQSLLVAITDRAGPDHLAALLAAGADDYLCPAREGDLLPLRLAVAERRAAASPAPACIALRRSGCMAHDGPYGVFRSGLDGRFSHVTPALARILGYDDPEELLAVDLATGVYRDPADRQHLVEKGADFIEGVELAWKRRDGTPITVRMSGRRVY